MRYPVVFLADSNARTVFVALLSAGGAGAVAQVVVGIINWANARHDVRVKQAVADHVKDDSDNATLRGIADGALAREKFAYEQLRIEQQRVESIQKVADEERNMRLLSEQKCRACEDQLEEEARQKVYYQETAERLERHVRMLEDRGPGSVGNTGGP
jgi:hypothetical protein